MQIAPTFNTRWAAIAKPHGTWTLDRHASGSHRDRVALRCYDDYDEPNCVLQSVCYVYMVRH